jgi:hypothetical protein
MASTYSLLGQIEVGLEQSGVRRSILLRSVCSHIPPLRDDG